jgi:hypothetical protein
MLGLYILFYNKNCNSRKQTNKQIDGLPSFNAIGNLN